MEILIVGGGIAGVTLAALLERGSVRPTIVERASDLEHAGYMLGLWPMGSRILHGLGLYEQFCDLSIDMKQYEIHDGTGDLINSYDVTPLVGRVGRVLTSTRPQLVELLRSKLVTSELRFNTALDQLEPDGDRVTATFSDGTRGTYDLVVGADGIHSRVRELMFGPQPGYDTKWGGWVWWAPDSVMASDIVAEYWGAGRFLGAYPTRRGIGVIGCAPSKGFDQPGDGRRARLLERFTGLGERVDQLIAALPGDDEEMFYWRLADVRAAEWSKGRVVLLGDSAAGFLPTAGIGASMAMESAAVLADELSRTDRVGIEHAISLFVKRRRRRVESIQNDSRKLARMMFVKSAPMAKIRDLATRFYSLEMFGSQIVKALDTPI